MLQRFEDKDSNTSQRDGSQRSDGNGSTEKHWHSGYWWNQNRLKQCFFKYRWVTDIGRLNPWVGCIGCGSKDYMNLRGRNTCIFMVRRRTYWTQPYKRWIWKYLFNQWICERPRNSCRKFSNCCLYNRKLQVHD